MPVKCKHATRIGKIAWEKIKDKLQNVDCDSCKGPASSLWLCLIGECGYIGCGESVKDHSSQHAEERNHWLTINLSTRRIWCYRCESEVSTEINNPPFIIKETIANTEANMAEVRLTCERHSNNKVDSFCEDHLQLCCYLCEKYLHSSCTKTISIGLAENKYRQPSNVQPVCETLSDLKQQFQICKVKREKELQEFVEQQNVFAQSLTEVHEGVVRKIDNMTNTVLQEKEGKCRGRMDALKADIGVCNAVIPQLGKTKEIVERGVDGVGLLVELHRASVLIDSDYSKHLSDMLESREHVEITFKPNSNLLKFLDTETEIGKIDIKFQHSITAVEDSHTEQWYSRLYSIVHIMFLFMYMHFVYVAHGFVAHLYTCVYFYRDMYGYAKQCAHSLSTFLHEKGLTFVICITIIKLSADLIRVQYSKTYVNIQTQDDVSDSFVTDINFLPNGNLLISDRANNKIKIINIQHYNESIFREYEINPMDKDIISYRVKDPFRVTSISNTKLVVSSFSPPSPPSTFIMDIESNEPTVTTIITEDADCRGMSVYDGKLYLACSSKNRDSSSFLLITDMDGRTLDKIIAPAGVIPAPSRVVITENNMYIDDSVTGMNVFYRNGTFLGKSGRIQSATKGFTFVNDTLYYIRKQDKVLKLSCIKLQNEEFLNNRTTTRNMMWLDSVPSSGMSYYQTSNMMVKNSEFYNRVTLFRV